MKYDPRLITFRTPSGWRRRRPDEKIQANDQVGSSGMSHWVTVGAHLVGLTPRQLQKSYSAVAIIYPKSTP